MTDWRSYRAALVTAWRELGGDAAARAAVLGAVVEEAAPGLWDGAASKVAGLPSPPVGLVGPSLPGLVLEALTPAGERRRAGVHHTPMDLARRLVALAVAHLDPAAGSGDRPPTVCDPAVGGGAFLLAAADELVARGGHDVAAVHAALHGCDVDPLAVRTSAVALRWWASDRGIDPGPPQPRLIVGDGLAVEAASWVGPMAEGFDLVVGNPPFLGQLAGATVRSEAERADLRGRFGAAAGGYVDAAGLFLLAATELARPGGVVCLVLPESILGSRDAGPLRLAVGERSALRDLWVAGEHVFDATVRVCAPVLVVGALPAPSVPVWRGPEITPVAPVARAADSDGDPFRGLVAVAYGTPPVVLPAGTGALGSRATASAGFRDQFYGLAPHVSEAADGAPASARLVTSGAIDPLWCRWGERSVRFAGRRWERPVLDCDALGAADPGLRRWVDQRLVPKLLLATQTKVLEVVVDPDGSLVPSVPVIAVIPVDDDSAELWALAAVLLAPAVSAWALHQASGTALAADGVKLSARQVGAVPLPCDAAAWRAAAAGLADGRVDPEAFAALMAVAYGLAPDHPVSEWWLGRLPSWRGEPRR